VRPHRHPRRGFGRLIATLLVLLAGTLAIRMGSFASLASAIGRRQGAHMPAREAAAGGTRGDLGDGSASSSRGSGAPASPARTAEDLALDRFAAIGQGIYCGGGTKPLVALTFDDGPGPYTEQTLRILRSAGATATFFLVGRNLAAWPDGPAEELALGAVGDHTWTHVVLRGRGAAVLQEEIARTQEALTIVAGDRIRLFRPPFGSHDAAVDEYAAGLGMVEVLWNVDSEDSAGAPPDQVLANAVQGARPGAIILMHENRGSTLGILPRLLQAISERGLQTVTVPQLLAADPPTQYQLDHRTCPVGPAA
jgi:peptidoglycan/xylan/chitin deacetylase (PgdA/CDA1 family)